MNVEFVIYNQISGTDYDYHDHREFGTAAQRTKNA